MRATTARAARHAEASDIRYLPSATWIELYLGLAYAHLPESATTRQALIREFARRTPGALDVAPSRVRVRGPLSGQFRAIEAVARVAWPHHADDRASAEGAAEKIAHEAAAAADRADEAARLARQHRALLAELATAEEHGYRSPFGGGITAYDWLDHAGPERYHLTTDGRLYLYMPDEDGDDQRVLVGQLDGEEWDRRR